MVVNLSSIQRGLRPAGRAIGRRKAKMLITIKEAAIRLGYHPSHVRRLVAAGILPATEISSRIRLINPDDLAKIARRKPGRKGKVKNG